VKEISGISSYLRWLPASGPIELAPGTGLVGHDGWADGRLGDYRRSPVLLNDYRLIDDFIGLDPLRRLALLNQLGDEAAEYFQRTLPEALGRWKRLIVLTHVPPFAEAAWHMGRRSDDNWLPHFSCRAVGDVLLETARSHTDCDIRVLCGHTHSGGEVDILPNLRITTGSARYGEPGIQAEWTED
jgi:hypothetical protein